ncbi:MAG: transglycosylase SLT domain-containing protein [Myxococcales bacterium]|nr:transglycosylase SLT domain-containing protein [Myxococcales bacterium]
MRWAARLLGTALVGGVLCGYGGVHASPATQLGDAYRAFEAGDFAEARKEATTIAAKRLRNPDYRLYVIAQSAYFEGDFSAALESFRELSKVRSSRLATRARWRVADALWQLDRKKEAAGAYESLIVSRASDGDLGVARYRVAKELVDLDQPRAIARFREFLRHHPAHRLSEAADYQLVAMGGGGIAGLSAKDRILRGRDLIASKKWEIALQELAELDPSGMDSATRLDHEFWLSMSLFKRRRHYEKAGRSFLSIYKKMGGRADEALFHAARALSRADFDTEAIENYQRLVEEYPHSKWAAEAQFLSGWLEFNRGRYREALPFLRNMPKRYHKSKFTKEVPWYMGMSYYLLGEHKESLPYFAKVAAMGGKEIGGKGRYWQAQAQQKLGKVAIANAAYRSLVDDYPFSWYALLARTHLSAQGITVGVFGKIPGDPARVPQLAAKPDRALGKDALIAKGNELIEAGLLAEAGVELFRGERAFLKRHAKKKADAMAVLLDAYKRAENYNRPWMLSVVHGGRGALNAEPEGRAKTWWQHAYPLAYETLVERYRKLSDFPDFYLYTIMRKESGFDPNTHSYADAQGLLQMIPPTTVRVVKHLGIEYTEDLLFDPERNIQTGAWYIGRLYSKFGRQIPVGAGSYNSGPRAVTRWLKRHGARPIDEFVELLSYRQTRKYMKRITETYARYKYLYKREVYEQPLELDSEFVVNEINY